RATPAPARPCPPPCTSPPRRTRPPPAGAPPPGQDRARAGAARLPCSRGSASPRPSPPRAGRVSAARARTTAPAPTGLSCSDLLRCRAPRQRAGIRKPVPARDFLAEARAAGGGEAVELRAPVVIGAPPLALDEPLVLQPVQRGVECALLNLERTARDLLD